MIELKPPYQYVLDTSALFDLKNNYPIEIFDGLWQGFNDMCKQRLIVAPREVYREINQGADELLDWANDHDVIFLQPCEPEQLLLEEIMKQYPREIIQKYSTKPWADPLVIACAKHYNLPIIQHESVDAKQYKIPAVASKFGLNCIRLTNFFAEQSWRFK